jgi:hypothetical protein
MVECCCQISIISSSDKKVLRSVDVLKVLRWVLDWDFFNDFVGASGVVIVSVDEERLERYSTDVDEHVGSVIEGSVSIAGGRKLGI